MLGRVRPVTLTPEAFDEMLAKIWQQSSGVSQQLVDDMDADIDLMALTEEIRITKICSITTKTRR